jgi:hypothetical protein
MGIQKFIGSINDLDSKKSGKVNANSAIITAVGSPIDVNDATNKKYVDDLYDKIDVKLESKTNLVSENGHISLDNYLTLTSTNGVEMVAQVDDYQSTLAMNRNIVIHSSSSETDNGGSVVIVTGDGKERGGNFEIALGSGEIPGKFLVVGTFQASGPIELVACQDPGQPEYNTAFLWFDINDKKVKIRKRDEDDLVLL